MARWDKPRKRPSRPRRRHGMTPDLFRQWSRLPDEERKRIAQESLRHHMREMAIGMGARTEDEIRAALEMVEMGCRTELDMPAA